MAATDIWRELGLARTTDMAAIRRAYAARLKVVCPDTDPQGFVRLREAYERARRAAQAPASDTPPAPPPSQPAVSAPPPAVVAEAPAPPPAEFTAVAEHIRRGEVQEAASVLSAARRSGALSLAQDLRLADRLGWVMAQDRALPADTVRAAAERLGWLGAEVTAPWAAALRARLDAEQWLASLRRDAASRWVWARASKPVVARILLGRGRLRIVPTMRLEPALRRRYGEFLLHAGLVAGQFDPVRIEAVARVLTPRKPTSWRVLLAMLVGLLLLAWVLGLSAGDHDPGPEDSIVGAGAIGLLLLLRVGRAAAHIRRCRGLR